MNVICIDSLPAPKPPKQELIKQANTYIRTLQPTLVDVDASTLTQTELQTLLALTRHVAIAELFVARQG